MIIHICHITCNSNITSCSFILLDWSIMLWSKVLVIKLNLDTWVANSWSKLLTGSILYVWEMNYWSHCINQGKDFLKILQQGLDLIKFKSSLLFMCSVCMHTHKNWKQNTLHLDSSYYAYNHISCLCSHPSNIGQDFLLLYTDTSSQSRKFWFDEMIFNFYCLVLVY